MSISQLMNNGKGKHTHLCKLTKQLPLVIINDAKVACITCPDKFDSTAPNNQQKPMSYGVEDISFVLSMLSCCF